MEYTVSFASNSAGLPDPERYAVGDILTYPTGQRWVKRIPGGWVPLSPYILDQSAIPRILPSSGSSNATGQITLTTALPYQPSGVVQIWLPAGVVTDGDQGTGAKLYNVIFSSTTVCQIQGTGIVTANGAYTQTTGSELTLATVVVPGGAMGANGALRVGGAASVPSNANTKTVVSRLSSTNIFAAALTTSVAVDFIKAVRNRGVQNAQIVHTASVLLGTGSAAPLVPSAIDTSINQNLTFTGQLAVATDFIILEGYTVEVLPEE